MSSIKKPGVLTVLSGLVHDERLAPAARLLWVELAFGGCATMAKLIDRVAWSRPTLLKHLAALEKLGAIRVLKGGRALSYKARSPVRSTSRLDDHRVRTILRITRHRDLTPSRRLVLIHLCLYSHHYIPANDRATKLAIPIAGFQEARAGIAAKGFAEHDHRTNSTRPKDGYRHTLMVPVEKTQDDEWFHDATQVLWKATGRTGTPHTWWWQSFRRLSKSEGINPRELRNLMYQVADHKGKRGFPQIHNPAQVRKHIPLLRKLRQVNVLDKA